MAKVKQPSAAAVLHYGRDVATIRANTKPKQWRQFVKFAHRQGHTVAGQLSGAPAPLMERTGASIRKEALRTVGTAYKPVMAALNQRESANKFLDAKRAEDDASYRQWLLGQTGLLDAQSRAADATLASQQQSIAQDLTTAQAAARADSLKRVAAAAGNVSDPQQSTALDTGAADTRSAELVANAREHTAALDKIGSDARTMSRAAVLATAAVAAATHQADSYQTEAQIAADRSTATQARAKDTMGMIQDLNTANVTNAQNNREADLAGAELGVKQQSLAATVQAANQKYQLDQAKFKLDRWKARNANTVARAKIKLGYDHIAATAGQKAADRALNKWLTQYREAQANKRNANSNATSRANARDRLGGKGGGGVTPAERVLYRNVETARSLIVQMQRQNLPHQKIVDRLRSQNFDASLIGVAFGLVANNGQLTPDVSGTARRMGILHPGYFWKPLQPAVSLGRKR